MSRIQPRPIHFMRTYRAIQLVLVLPMSLAQYQENVHTIPKHGLKKGSNALVDDSIFSREQDTYQRELAAIAVKLLTFGNFTPSVSVICVKRTSFNSFLFSFCLSR